MRAGARRPRWSGTWRAGAVRRGTSSLSQLPRPLQDLLRADVVVATLSSVCAEEWAPSTLDPARTTPVGAGSLARGGAAGPTARGLGHFGQRGGGGVRRVGGRVRKGRPVDVDEEEVDEPWCGPGDGAEGGGGGGGAEGRGRGGDGCVSRAEDSDPDCVEDFSSGSEGEGEGRTLDHTPWMGRPCTSGPRLSCLHQVSWSHLVLEMQDSVRLGGTSRTAQALGALVVSGEQWWVSSSRHAGPAKLPTLLARFAARAGTGSSNAAHGQPVFQLLQ